MEFEQLLTLFKETHQELQKRAARSVDITLVIRNWLFGWYIVEFEQGDATRAELYGKKLIDRLSAELKAAGLTGVSPTSLKQCRVFYNAYREIGQALPVESLNENAGSTGIGQALTVQSHSSISGVLKIFQAVSAELANRFVLGWTHYISLLSITNQDERRFYEIEARENSWGARELERQIASLLYERLSLSRDKERDKLTHQDLGQMQMYVNYFDRYVKTEDELPTIGILLCHRKSDALVELTLPEDSNIFASKYQLYLPSKEELKKELEDAAGIEHE